MYVCTTRALTCPETVKQGPRVTSETKTRLVDSKISYHAYRSQRPVLSLQCAVMWTGIVSDHSGSRDVWWMLREGLMCEVQGRPAGGCGKHRRSQDFLWGMHLFSSKKLTTFFLFLLDAIKTHAKTITLTIPTLQVFPMHQKCALKFDFLLCLGVHLPVWGCTYNFPHKLRLQFFFSALGVHMRPVHPWLCLWW